MILAHPRSESKGAAGARKPAGYAPRPYLPDVVVGQRVMAQQGGAVRKGIVYPTLNWRLSSWRTILPATGIDPKWDLFQAIRASAVYNTFETFKLGQAFEFGSAARQSTVDGRWSSEATFPTPPPTTRRSRPGCGTIGHSQF